MDNQSALRNGQRFMPATGVMISGSLVKQPEIERVVGTEKQLCRFALKVFEMEIPVFAKGEPAVLVSKQPDGAKLRIYGKLCVEDWSARNGDKHHKIEVEAMKVFLAPQHKVHRFRP